MFLAALAVIPRSTAYVSSASSAFARGNRIVSGRKYSSSKLSMKLQTAIVGLPNVGKSTLFNALTESQAAEAANYPFCTIEPNVGIVTVPDPKLQVLEKINKSVKVSNGQQRNKALNKIIGIAQNLTSVISRLSLPLWSLSMLPGS